MTDLQARGGRKRNRGVAVPSSSRPPSSLSPSRISSRRRPNRRRRRMKSPIWTTAGFPSPDGPDRIDRARR